MFTTTPDPLGMPQEWPSGYYLGDGFRGTYSCHDFMRRCGVGVHYVHPDITPGFEAWQPLCGPVQTVPRSELTALLIEAQRVHSGANLDFFTYSKIFKDTYYEGLSRARFAANSDLWVELCSPCEYKHLSLHLYWMPSHTKDNPDKRAKAPS